jgi:hypothetical protein
VFVVALITPLWFSFLCLMSMDPRALVVLVMFVPWSANVAYWLAVHRQLIGQGRRAVTPGVLAVLLGLSALVLPLGLSFFPFPAGRFPVAYRSGYWLWLGSMALHALGSRALVRARAREIAIAQYWDD